MKMSESIAERVAREWIEHSRGLGGVCNHHTDQECLARRIQAAIDEAVLHNFTVGELVEVAVRVEREACAKEAERWERPENAAKAIRARDSIAARKTCCQSTS
jgi:hypothetical protein